MGKGTESRNKARRDYIESLIASEEAQLNVEGAAHFNSFNRDDQNAILVIYRLKAEQQDLCALLEDDVTCIEEVTKLYRAQKDAFQDVLTEKSFTIASEVPKDYHGRIAILTNHGTFIILGILRNRGRNLTMSRIHSPQYNYDHQLGHLNDDLRLGAYPELSIVSGGGYSGSVARALAVNPNGADGDEREESDTITRGIGARTAAYLIKPREVPVDTEGFVRKKPLQPH